MAIDIGGMLARSGAVTGQAMGQGLANLGTGIGAGVGGMLTRRREQRLKEEEAARMAQMGPVDLAKYAEQKAMKTGDVTKVLQAQQFTQDVIQQRTK